METCTYGLGADIWKPTTERWQGAEYRAYWYNGTPSSVFAAFADNRLGVLFGGLHLNSVSRQLLARYGGIFSQYQEKIRKSADIIPNNSAIFIVFNKIWLSLVWHFNSFHYLCTQIIIIVLWQK